MNVADIKQEALRVIEAILANFHQENPTLTLTGLACEIDPGAASLYISLCDSTQNNQEAISKWPHSLDEQEVKGLRPPAWFDQYHILLSRHYKDHEISYEPIKAALTIILDGIAQSIAELEKTGQLARIGFAKNPILSVWTEDDADDSVGKNRIAKYLHHPA